VNLKKLYQKSALYLIVTGVVLGLVLLGGRIFPQYATRLFGLGIYLLIDLAYWKRFSGYAADRMPVLRKILRVSYWIPLLLFVIFLLASWMKPVQDWPMLLRVYSPGILVVAFIWKILLVLSMLLTDILLVPFRLPARLKARRQNIPLNTKPFRFPVTIGLTSGTLVALLALSGFVFWVYDFQVRTVEVKIKELPRDLDGLKIVQLSDIHLGSWASAVTLKRAVTMINAQHPDIMVFTGDMVNLITDEAYPFYPVMRELHASGGIYAVLGNHDYGNYANWKSQQDHERNNRELENFYQRLGWKLLKNSSVILHRGRDSIALIGVENWSTKKIWGQRGDLSEAMRGTAPVAVKILLSHDPTHWDRVVTKEYPDIVLTLSGHTHAMQMGWETNAFRWSPAAWMYDEWAGLYEKSNNKGQPQYLYVNRGLGTLGFPARIGERPEITVIVLRKG